MTCETVMIITLYLCMLRKYIHIYTRAENNIIDKYNYWISSWASKMYLILRVTTCSTVIFDYKEQKINTCNVSLVK